MGFNRFLTYFYEMLLICNICNLGMMVDLAHVSADTMRAVLQVSRAPIMFSHSSARSISNVTRNVPDDVLEMVVGNLAIMCGTLNGSIKPICKLKPFKVKTYILILFPGNSFVINETDTIFTK